MKFKDYFLVKENPDDLYGSLNFSGSTFIFCESFIAYSGDPEVTHHDLLMFMKKTFLKVDYIYFVPNNVVRYYKDKEKSFHYNSNPPEKLLELLKKKKQTRNSILFDEANLFLGRISFNKKIMSFWNNVDSFSNTDKNTVKKVAEIYKIPYTELVYNFYSGPMEEDVYLKPEQFFKNTENISKKTSDTSHIIHNVSPELKGNLMKQMGMKPKTAKGAEQRYLNGESFKSFFQNINEDAESVRAPNGRWTEFHESDARAFLIEEDFNMLAKSKSYYHFALFEMLYTMTNGKSHGSYVHGTPSKELENYIFSSCDQGKTLTRDDVLKNFPNVILGRLWLESKVVGFWNIPHYLKNNLSYIEKMFRDNNLNPNEFLWEVPDTEDVLTWEEFKKDLKGEEEITDDDRELLNQLQQKAAENPLHLLPPEKKAEEMKKRGIKPKPAKGVEQRYLNGESFFNHFKTLTESPDITSVRGKDYTRLTWGFFDAKAFLIDSPYYVVAKRNSYVHGTLMKELLQIYDQGITRNENDFIQNDTPPKSLLSKIKKDYRNDRTPFLKIHPNIILGRIWTDNNIISFWNDSKFVKEQLPTIIKMIENLGLNPNETVFELNDSEIFTLQELQNLQNKNENPKENEDWKNAIHNVSPEIKGNLMKQKGIKPKTPINIEDKYPMGESFKNFFNKQNI